MTKTQDKAPAKADTSASKQNKTPAKKVQTTEGYGERFRNFKEYLVLSRLELRKVSWPTMKETRTTSLVVLGFVTVMAILLGLVDLLLSSSIRFILS